MKLTCVLIFAIVLQAGAKGGFSQSVSLSEKNTRLESVLKKIEKQTGYYFWYENKIIRGAKKVSINVQNVPLNDVLDICFANQPFSYLIIDKTIVVKEKGEEQEKRADDSESLFSQAAVITGTITDEAGTPLSGASVTIKGTSQGTSTDSNGQFSIEVPDENAILVVSFIGRETQEIKVNGQRNLRVSLKISGTQQQEIVVIGYGTQKKKEVTGAISSVRVGELSQDVSRNLSSALQGRVAGVTLESNSGAPGAGLSITIRGSGSLGSNAPLVVVDGVFASVDFVNPSDVESIDILKDASAASIYGSRAANGVIIITTKSGKKNSPARVQLNAVSGVQSIPKRIGVLDGRQWTDVFQANVSGIPDWDGTNTNWQDVTFRTASLSRLNLNVSGGTQNLVYNMSGGYWTEQGTIRESGASGANFRIKTQYEKGRLKTGETVIVNYGKSHSLASAGDQPGVKNGILVMVPTVPVYDTANQLGGWGRRESYMKNLSNPLANLTAKNGQNSSISVLAEAFAEIRLIDQLKYKFNVGLTNSRGYSVNYTDVYDDGNVSVAAPQISKGGSNSLSWLIENTLSYDKKIGLHSFSILAGYTSQKDSSNNLGASGTGLPLSVYSLDAVTANRNVSGGSSSGTRISMLGRVTYSYDSRYLLTASVRRDGSSAFANGYQFGVFPSFSAGWNLSNEKFFHSIVDKGIITDLKLRGGWGILGNDLISAYSTQSVIITGVNYVQGNQLWQGSFPAGTASARNLRWEESESTNIGLDATFFRNKLALTLDVFKRTTSGILLSVPVPPSLGIGGNPVVNAGVVENKGLELALNYADKAGKLSYDIGFNIATLKNKMTAITIGSGEQQFGDITRARVGNSLGVFWLIKTDGIFQSDAEAAAYVDKNNNRIQPNASAGDIRFVDYNNDGQINADDRHYVGSPFPTATAGLSAFLKWQGWDLNILFQGTFGNKIYNSSRIWLEKMTEVTNLSTDVLKAWTPGSNSGFPRFILADPNQNARTDSDRWLEDGAYVRLKRLELGYTILPQLYRKLNIEKIRVNVSAENLFTITKYSGFNPDLGNGGDPLSRGIDEGRFVLGSIYPLQRIFMFGLNVNF
ncbi:MAG: TonB-dependent receptor [Chitinophagaceae bacterium]|nr:TonB-dependent receptor [Chitinophagaceae bacterium]